ncbi:hypothetical protein [Clostridium formicaceticum]|uniref:Uncharacterized protein n=1 Tax=Clostridium formicaceticum TaxID=1497 RepID=A0AAC9RGH3_9CLOT|nr:hypothetical protein [Clostridium formicaceticum]AOY76089.1 hypothetical protein BJL90_09350 [Clostridium formicaceticum]ARE86451.1 hypothetical protein CLFO_07730 [Clostridium formicaceticum]
MSVNVIWLTVALLLTVILIVFMLKTDFAGKLQLFSLVGWITFLCYYMAIGLPRWTLHLYALICVSTAMLYRLKYIRKRKLVSKTAKQL